MINIPINLDFYIKFYRSIVNQSKEVPNQHPPPAPVKPKVEKPNPLPQKPSQTPPAREPPQHVNVSKANTNTTTVEETGTNQKLSLRERMTAKLFKSSPNSANKKPEGKNLCLDCIALVMYSCLIFFIIRFLLILYL